MDGLRKPQMTSFVADVRFDCPTMFWSEGMVCEYVTEFDVSTDHFSGQRNSLNLQVPWAGCTNIKLVSVQTGGHTHAHIFMPMGYVRSSHSHDYEDLPTFRKRNFLKFLPEDDNLNFHHTFLAFWCAQFRSTPEDLGLHRDTPNLLLSRYPKDEVFGASIWPLTSSYYQGFKTQWSCIPTFPLRLHRVQRSFSNVYKHSLNIHWLHVHTHVTDQKKNAQPLYTFLCCHSVLLTLWPRNCTFK